MSTKSVAALDLESKNQTGPMSQSKITPPKPASPEASKSPIPSTLPKVAAVKSPPPPPAVATTTQTKQSPPKIALDGNQNATAPSLPVVPPALKKPVEPDPLVKIFPKNIPHWFVITYTYP